MASIQRLVPAFDGAGDDVWILVRWKSFRSALASAMICRWPPWRNASEAGSVPARGQLGRSERRHCILSLAATAMMAAADTAMYEAKRSGRGNYAVYNAAMARGVEEQRILESDLRVAVAERQFRLVFQPVRRTDTGEVTGFEALIRWDHPERCIVSPAMFIPAAEQGGLILPIGARVLETACTESAAWEGGQFLAVNMSPPQFMQPDFCAQVADVAQDRSAGEPPRHRGDRGADAGEFRIVLRNMDGLREMGVRLSLDDFGTGHSSLSYLRRFPVDRIKIDRSFVQDLPGDNESRAIVASVLTLGRSLRISVLAEGVEIERQLDELRAMRCEQVQGYLLGRPVTPEAAMKLAAAGPDSSTFPTMLVIVPGWNVQMRGTLFLH